MRGNVRYRLGCNLLASAQASLALETVSRQLRQTYPVISAYLVLCVEDMFKTFRYKS